PKKFSPRSSATAQPKLPISRRRARSPRRRKARAPRRLRSSNTVVPAQPGSHSLRSRTFRTDRGYGFRLLLRSRGMTARRTLNAYRGARPASVRQGGVGGVAQARRGRRRRLRGARERGGEGRPAQGGGARGAASGLPAGLLPQAGGVVRVQGAQAGPAGDGLRHPVRAGGVPQYSDQRFDPIPSLAAAEISRP